MYAHEHNYLCNVSAYLYDVMMYMYIYLNR